MTTSNPTPRPLRRFVLVLLTALMMLTTVGVTAPNADAAPAYGGWSSTAIRTLCQLNGDSARESVDYYELGAIDDDGNRTQYRFRLICEFTHDEKDVSIRCNAFGTHWVDWLMFKAGAETSMTCTFDVTPHSNDDSPIDGPVLHGGLDGIDVDNLADAADPIREVDGDDLGGASVDTGRAGRVLTVMPRTMG